MNTTPHLLSATQIKAEAHRLGFYACGLAPAEPVAPAHAAFFRLWIGKGQHADMGYLENHEEKRLHPRLLEPGTQTIISVALNYYPPVRIPENRLQLSWYAYGTDYHTVMKQKLNQLLHALSAHYANGALQGRCFCDTAPVLEKYWAWRCGLGWIGKHTQLVIPNAGSTFFLGELFLNLPADNYDTPLAPRCGPCTRCIDACPTHALSPHHGLDCRQCLSYLTIEHRGEIPEETAQKMYPYFYGCDRCQQACPHICQASPTAEPAFRLRPALQQMTDEQWEHLDIEKYRILFKDSAVKRAKYEGLMRNLKAMNK